MTTAGEPVIVTDRLSRRFGPLVAVRDVSLTVQRGEIFGVLGPNGAGKTTMLKMLATLLPIDAGEATIFGVDVRREAHVVRQLLGRLVKRGPSEESFRCRLVRQQRLHLATQHRVACAGGVEESGAGFRRERKRLVEESIDFCPTVRRHLKPAGRFRAGARFWRTASRARRSPVRRARPRRFHPR